MTDDAPPPADIEPDTKDWLWVLTRRCDECGFNASGPETDDFPALIEELAERIRLALDRPGSHTRPTPHTWSVVEYGQHVADVCEVMRLRLESILDADGAVAEFDSWDADEAAAEKEYWRASGEVTSILLRERAEAAADSFAEPTGDQWTWPGRRGDGAEFTAETLGRYLLHELAHHAHDVSALRPTR